MAWVVDPDSIVAGDAGSGGVDAPGGSYCPTSWEEDFDRAQMSTEVLINHQTPSDVPVFRYYFPGTLANPPVVGQITLNNTQTTATIMRVSKFDATAHEIEVWLRYVQKNCTVSITSVARSDADDNNKTRGYRVTGPPVEKPGHFEWPIFWTDGTTAIDPGPVDLKLSIVAETPQLWGDSYGISHYGHLTFTRTDLIRVDPLSNTIYKTLAGRILNIRGSTSVPRLASVTIDARTSPDWLPIHNMNLMVAADPGKPSRYMCCLKVGARTIYHRMCFASSVRHVITRDEWTLTIGLDVAEWAGTL